MTDNLIYGLCCPITGRLHYVGQSSTNLFRPLTHMSRSHSSKIREWVNELKEFGLKPEIKVLEEVEFIDFLRNREKYWIQKSINEGCYLLNIQLNTAKDLITEKVRNYTPPNTSKFLITDEGEDYLPHNPNPYKELASVVIYKRTNAGLTIEELSKYTNLSVGFIRETEKGKERMINFQNTVQLLDFFGLTIKYRGHSAFFEITSLPAQTFDNVSKDMFFKK